MDKFEYKVRADEIKELIATGDYAQAADIADTIDWRRVKSVMMLCTISDLYKINRRYEDAKNMLLLAYERRPGGKTICYSLCELCIKTEEYVQAINYYKEFVQVAPKDPGRYILQYKLYEAQDVGLEERIGVLEELKKRDYREKWAYELAYLYHRVGLATRCVEECDELILWFGEGKYVIKAMELKMLHEPLTPGQQAKYDPRFAKGEIPEQTRPEGGDSYEEPQELWAETPSDAQPEQQRVVYPEVKQPETKEEPEEMDIQVKTMDVGEYNTINLQAELAAGLKEVLAADQKSREDAVTRSILSPMIDADTESLSLPEIDEVNEGDFGSEAEVMEGSEVFFGATGDLGNLQERSQEQPTGSPMGMEEILPEEEEQPTVLSAEEPEATEQPTAKPEEAIVSAGEPEEPVPATEETDETARTVMNELRMESEEQVLKAQPPKELAGVLSQESDGQIRLVVPESEAVEKQITGQMSIEDILTEWEKLKKVNEAKRQEEVRQHVLEQTGTMFTEFEAAVRDGLLEQLENQQAAAKDDETDEPVEIAEAEAPEEVTEAEDVAETEESGEAQDAASEEYGEAEEIEEIEEAEEVEAAAEPENAEDQTESPAEPEHAEDRTESPAEPEETEEVAEAEIVAETEESGEAQDAADEEYGEVEEIEEIEEVEAAEPKAPEEVTGAENFAETTEESEQAVGQTENPAEPEQAAKADEPVEREKPKVRALTREEKELYGPFIQSRSGKEKLVKAIDSISMAAYTGNIIITGEEGMDTLSLAKNMIREIQMTDSNFSGKVAKISGQGMNARNVEETLEHLKNGALIIQKASKMEKPAVEALCKTLQKENFGIIIALEDTKKAIGKLFKVYPELQESFTARMDVEAMSNDSLAAFGRQYAKKQEYSIDELGMLALHTCIEERQTIDHVVTVLDVKEIVDEAIHHANRKTLGHFFDILFAKRYDEEDMIILTEKDFV